MTIERSVRGVMAFLQDNDALIKDIKDRAADARALAERLEKNKAHANHLLNTINDLPFAVTKDRDVRAKQKRLVEQIVNVGKDMQAFVDEPDILTLLWAQRGALYVALGNTYNDLVADIVTFSQAEIDDLRNLLRRATLDTESRQRYADLLDGAIQLTKFGLRTAAKLVA